MKRSLPRPMLFFIVVLMDMLAGMEFDIFVPSFPELQQHFNLSAFWVEATLSANFLGFCISLFFVGVLSDRYGRKPIISFGLMIFISGSMLCLWGQDYEMMLVGRFFQGVGIAAPAILSFLIIADIYPLKQQTSLFAILNGFMNFSVGAAPVLGSYIALYFGWQGSFMTLLVVGIVVLLMVMLFIPSGSPPQTQKQHLLQDYLSLFKSVPLVLMIIHFMMQLVPYWIFVGMSPLLYMEELGVSLSHFGFYQGAIATVFGFGSILFGFVIHKFDQQVALRTSILIFIFSVITISIATLIESPSALMITLCFIPFTIGEIIPSAILYPVCIGYIPEAKGRVSSIIQGGRLMFSALSVQIAGFYYAGSFTSIGLLINFFIIMTILSLTMVMSNNKRIKGSDSPLRAMI